MAELNFASADFSKLKYAKVIYTGMDGKPHEVRTEIRSIDDLLISVYFKYKKDFNISYPQKVKVKLVAEDGLYVADATLQKIERADTLVYLSIAPPLVVDRQQNRRYYRIKLQRPCVLMATDKHGQLTAYMSKLVDVSAGGIMIHQLETMFEYGYVSIEPTDYVKYNVVLFLDVDIALKLSARYVRQEKTDASDRYAFEFIDTRDTDIDIISKYVTKEQVERLKSLKPKR